MNQEQLMRVLIAPRISEKSTRLADDSNQFVFDVIPEATKPNIKKAVELMFDVEVDSVQVCNVKGKQKRFKGIRGRRAGVRKAYVRLKSGHDIDFMGAEG